MFATEVMTAEIDFSCQININIASSKLLLRKRRKTNMLMKHPLLKSSEEKQ